MAKVRMLLSKRKRQQLNQNRVDFVRRKVARRSEFPSPLPSPAPSPSPSPSAADYYYPRPLSYDDDDEPSIPDHVPDDHDNLRQNRWIFIGKNKRMATWWRRKIARTLKFPSPSSFPSLASPSASSSSSSDYGYCRRLSFDDDDDEPSTTNQASRIPPPASPPPPGFPFPIYKAKSPFFTSEDDCSNPYHIPDAKPPSSLAMAATASTQLSRGCCRPRTTPQSSPPPPGFPFPIYRPLASDFDDSATYPFYYDCPSSSHVSSSLPSLTLTLAPPGRCHGHTTTSSPYSCSQRLLLPDLNA